MYEMTPEVFVAIHEELGGKQVKTAQVLNISQAAVSNYLGGKTVSKRQATKIIKAYQEYQDGSPLDIINKPVSAKVKTKKQESVSEVIARITMKFAAMEDMRDRIVDGKFHAMIVAGSAGVGKSYNIIEPLEARGLANLRVVKGGISAPGLYQLLYDNKDGLVVFDDCDALYDDDESLNLLKAALDTTGRRQLSWNKATKGPNATVYSVAQDGDRGVVNGQYPNVFTFNGGVIFITNVNLKERGASNKKSAPHCRALMSRSNYLDLNLWTIQERILWMKDVFTNQMAVKHGLTDAEADEIMQFVTVNSHKFNDLSLRLLAHCVEFYQADKGKPGGKLGWKQLVEVFHMENE